MLNPEKYANGGQVLVKSALKSATHDSNCKNCGGTRTFYSCDYCGTEYAPKPKPIVVVKLTLWQRFKKWFSSLFRKEVKSNATKTAIIVGAIAVGLMAALIIYKQTQKKKINEKGTWL